MKAKQKVLITGGAGLIGIPIIKLLIQQGYEVNILDLNPIGAADRFVGQNANNITYYQGSVLEKNDIETAIMGCNYVIHLAAVMGVEVATTNPIKCLDINVLGTKNVLEACVKYNISKILLSSSSEVYGEPDRVPIDESFPLRPKSEYGRSKVMGEEYVKAYYRECGLEYVIVRLFNVYGEEQRDGWVMSTFTTQAVSGKPLVVNGDGEQIRSFCHANDAARGIVMAITDSKANNQIFNIGNAKASTSIKKLGEKILNYVKSSDKMSFINMEDSDRTAQREIYKRIPATAKAQTIFGFTAEITLQQGIKNIVEHKKEKLKEKNNA